MSEIECCEKEANYLMDDWTPEGEDKTLTLGEFREYTQHLPADTEMVFQQDTESDLAVSPVLVTTSIIYPDAEYGNDDENNGAYDAVGLDELSADEAGYEEEIWTAMKEAPRKITITLN